MINNEIKNVEILNFYYCNDVVNSILIHGIDALVVVDSGIQEKKELLLKEVGKYNFKKIFVILTHAHPDHIGNNYVLKESYNPIFITNVNSKKLIEDYKYQFDKVVGQTKKYFDITKKLKDFYFGLLDKEIRIDISFYDEMNIDLNSVNLNIVHLPGHTIGDIGIIDEKNKLLILSELIFKHSRETIIYIENYKKYINSLNVVKRFVKRLDIGCLITSHEEKPIVGKDEILDLVQCNLDYINKLRSNIEKLYKKEYSIEEIAKKVCEIYEKDYTFDSIVTVKSLIHETNKVSKID
jgi:glyoxylase-like metal-dependent hydrolase (beta-lactamase superfamily II)